MNNRIQLINLKKFLKLPKCSTLNWICLPISCSSTCFRIAKHFHSVSLYLRVDDHHFSYLPLELNSNLWFFIFHRWKSLNHFSAIKLCIKSYINEFRKKLNRFIFVPNCVCFVRRKKETQKKIINRSLGLCVEWLTARRPNTLI